MSLDTGPRQHRAPVAVGESSPLRVVQIAILFSLLAALGELLILGYRGVIQRRLVGTGIHALWMTPLAELLVIGGSALLAIALTRWGPRPSAVRVVTLVAAFLSYLSLLLMFSALQRMAMALLAAGLAVQTSRLVVKHWRGFETLLRRAFGPAVVAMVVLGGGSSLWTFWTERRLLTRLPPALQGAPNVLLIILDTVRAASLSLYGYSRPTTPNIDRLAQRGVVFQRAIAAAPWTLPSHASLFTGRWPHETTADFQSPLDGTHRTLAEVLASRGYATAGFVGNVLFCGKETGLARGFAHYDDIPPVLGRILYSSSIVQTAVDHWGVLHFFGYHNRLSRKSAEWVNQEFLDWLPENSGRPFFAFVNYFDTHRPYLPPAPFDHQFAPDNSAYIRWEASKRTGPPSADEIQAMTDAYDGALAYLDQELGRLMAELEQRGLLRNTVVIITSDHGEQLGEHGLYDHANSLYIQLLHVPLLISAPGRVPAGLNIPEGVSLRDLPATVADLVLGDPGRFPSRSLARFWTDGGRKQEPDVLLATLSKLSRRLVDRPAAKGGMRSLIHQDLHYINGGGVDEELFDLKNDPREERNLAASETGRMELVRLRAMLDSTFPGDSGSKAAPVAGP